MPKFIILFLLVSIITLIPINDAHAEENIIPSWIKQIAIFWGEGKITETEFLEAMDYLIKVGILSIPESSSSIESIELLAADHNIHPDATPGIITRIIDGDTLVFNGDKYRLSLIDTPELRESGFNESTYALKILCPKGSTAYMETDSIQSQDKYGRFLGVVWCEGNGYSSTAGEHLFDNGLVKKFYVNYCNTTEAATKQWAEESNNWFYYYICN